MKFFEVHTCVCVVWLSSAVIGQFLEPEGSDHTPVVNISPGGAKSKLN